MKSEAEKRLLKMAKQILPEETLIKIKEIKDAEETEKAIKYLLISYLERLHHKIEHKITEMESQGKDIFTAKNTAFLIPSKIKHFQVEFSESEFNKIIVLIKKIKSELKDVAI